MISTIPGKVHAKIEKKLLTSFWENALKCKKGTILTFWPLKNNLYSDSTKSFLCYVGNVIPKKLHAKKEKKLLKRFWDWPFPPLKVDADDDGQVGIWKAPLPDGTAELKMCMFGYSGGPGWPINNRTGPILLPRHPLTYINLHIKYGSNPIRIF